MWRNVFEERNGRAFAIDHLQFNSESSILKVYGNKGPKVMYWNIRIV